MDSKMVQNAVANEDDMTDVESDPSSDNENMDEQNSNDESSDENFWI